MNKSKRNVILVFLIILSFIIAAILFSSIKNNSKIIDLSKIIVNKDLGKLENNNESTVKTALKEKNQELVVDQIKLTINSVDAIETKDYTVVVEPIENSTFYTGKVEGITFNTEKFVFDDLSKIIVNKDLGKLEDNNESTVKTALKEKNQELVVDQIKLTINSVNAIETKDYTVVVEPIENSTLYTGKVEGITFSTEKFALDDLSKIIVNKDLGKLENNNESTVKTALKEKNQELVVDQIKLTINSNDAVENKNYTAVVEPVDNSTLYTGKVEGITFSTEKFVLYDLATIIVNKELGNLENTNESTVKQALKDKNKKLVVDEIVISSFKRDSKENDETIRSYILSVYAIKGSSLYTGHVEGVTLNVDFKDNFTYYININMNEMWETSIEGSAPEGVKQITHFGYDNDGLAYKVPSSVRLVPSKISTKITKTDSLFEDASNFDNELNPLENWNVSNVTSMKAMFAGATNFRGYGLDNWDVSKVTDMSYMFAGATNFRGYDLNQWGNKTGNVENMSYMFLETKIDFGLDNWDVSKVTNMEGMFDGAEHFNNLLKWNTSNVTNMTGMFKNALSFDQDLSDWDVSKVTSMNYMFVNAKSFTGKGLTEWSTSSLKDMVRMFNSASKFNANLSGWDVSNVTDKEDFDLGATSWEKNNKPDFKNY